VGALIEQIDRARAERGEPAGNLSSAVRVFVLEESVQDR
jgi:predicted DNA-binding ribbon-helix-helix protein